MKWSWPSVWGRLPPRASRNARREPRLQVGRHEGIVTGIREPPQDGCATRQNTRGILSRMEVYGAVNEIIFEVHEDEVD